MSWRMLVMAAVVVLVIGLTLPAHSFEVTYPDGDLAFEENLAFGQHLAVFWNLSQDGDIFTFQADAVGNALAVSLEGSPLGFAYWFQFLGFDAFGNRIFNVFITQGGSFFFVEQVAL